MKSLQAIIAAIIAVTMPLAAVAGEGAAGNAWKISLGGKLYDNQWLQTGTMPPDMRNPEYPAGVAEEPANTWRCVSCHGWDYRGRDGHLGRISSARAFASLRNAAGASVRDIAEMLRASSHGALVQSLNREQIDTLALFVSVGQHDVTALLVDGKAIGEPARGKDVFEGACISCHQVDGKAYIEGESGDKPALGWVAQHKAQQTLHKIRNGVPGADMLSMRFLEPSQLADLMAYLQTLDPNPQ